MTRNASRAKGNRREAQIVQRLKDAGCDAQRIPLSGSAGGKFKDDVTLSTPRGLIALQGEVKARKSGAGFATIERWLDDSDVLFLIRDRADPVVVLPWNIFERLLQLG